MTIELTVIKNVIESAIFASSTPLSIEKLQQLFNEPLPLQNEMLQALALIEQDYEHRSVELKRVASGYRFQVRQEYAPWIAKLWEEKPARYSRALLETLVLIAYRQPITRGEIEDVRGVAVSTHIIKSIMDREWIRVVGHRDMPGKPALYATTKQFLDYFNLKTLEDLPTLSELQSLDDIEQKLGQQMEIELQLAEPSAEEVVVVEVEEPLEVIEQELA